MSRNKQLLQNLRSNMDNVLSEIAQMRRQLDAIEKEMSLENDHNTLKAGVSTSALGNGQQDAINERVLAKIARNIARKTNC